MRTFDSIVPRYIPGQHKYGAPMGRPSTGTRPTDGTRIFDCAVPLDSGGYDRGGHYWGTPSNLRVSYTRDLSFIHFYRTTPPAPFKSTLSPENQIW